MMPPCARSIRKRSENTVSVEKVKAYFAGFGMEDRVLEFPVFSATVADAAAALH